ncbi:Acg family FMN-binding oxidoreductase [Cryptosporangium japonicum]|uniref:Nitroreductase family protein n=1 Tax=Cryptosporangium japonicum TaxID=80872 RepID=A0ABP3D3K6_9ACTN
MSGRAAIEVLTEATLAALRAPSVLNTQPWRWCFVGDTAELLIEGNRRLRALDPEGRLLLISCGAALDHAVTALRADGYAGSVERLPDEARPDLVARLRIGPPCAPEPRNHEAIYRRQTERRPFAEEPPATADLDALSAAAVQHGVRLRFLTPEELPSFGDIAEVADIVEHAERSLLTDLRTWTTRPAVRRDGLPGRTVVPDTGRTVPTRTFRREREGQGSGTDGGTVYGVLLTERNDRLAWLVAREALSDVWLTLTSRGLVASPISEVVEIASARRALRSLLGAAGHPAIALRIGVPADTDAPPRTVRRPNSDALGFPGRS